MKMKSFFAVLAAASTMLAYGQQPVIDSLENIMKNTREDTTIVNCLNSLSSHYNKIGDYEMAMLFADSALASSIKFNFKKGQAEALRSKGIILRYLGNYPEALQNLQVVIDLYNEIDYKTGLVAAYNSIGSVYRLSGSYPEALQNFSTAKEISEEIGYMDGLAAAYTGLGTIYSSQYNYAEAVKMFLAANKIYEEKGNKKNIAIEYNNLGTVYSDQGNFSEALKMFQAALKIDNELGYRPAMASDYYNIGLTYRSLRNFTEEYNSLIMALEIAEETGNPLDIVDFKISIGHSLSNLGKFSDAEDYLISAIKTGEETGYREGAASAHEFLGKIFMEQHQYSKAETQVLYALKIFRDLGRLEDISNTYLHLGDLFIKSAKLNEARKYLLECISLSKEIENKYGIVMAYRALYEIDTLQGNYESALKNHLLYTQYSDSMFSEESKLQIEQLKIQYATEKKDQEIALLSKEKELQKQQLERQRLVRNGMIAGTVLILLVGILLFRSFRLRKKLERQEAIIQERKRISADLHDEVGSGLSRIMLLSELVKNVAKTPETKKEAIKIATISQELSSNISEIIWALNSNNDYVENLVAYIRRYAAEYFDNSPVKLRIITPGNISHIPISGEHRRNIFYAIKEALHNIIKHSEATEAELTFALKHNVLSVIIKDNGKGLPEGELNRFGNGLNNMRNRMQSIHGNISIENHVGTKITLSLPV